MAATILVTCQGASTDVDLGIGDVAPAEIDVSGPADVLFVTTLEDCFSCRIQDGFVALRSAQRTVESAVAPRLTALLVAQDVADTLSLSRTLQYERITARVRTMTPREAGRLFDLGRVPAIYLLTNGRVVREWESTSGATIDLGRNDIRSALAEIGRTHAEP